MLGFSLIEVQSQSLMTVGEIYDYNIGDIFISRGGGYIAPPIFAKVIITNRYFNAGFDTIYYSYDLYRYSPPACSACVAMYDTTYGISIAYTNLNDTVGAHLGSPPHYISMNCVDTTGYTGIWVDTIYYDSAFCNVLSTKIERMDNMQYDSVNSCYYYFEPLWGYDEYGKGLGLKSHYYNTCSMGGWGCEEGLFLLYYKKGTDSCGTAPIIPLPTNVNESKFATSFKISPNPFSSKTVLTFFDEQKNSVITITNFLGEEVRKINFSGRQLTLEKESLKNGMYFVQVDDRKNIFTLKLIVQ